MMAATQDEPMVGVGPGDIPDRLTRVRRRIDDAARAAGRDPRDVRLVAISKFQPLAAVQAAVAAGQSDFGENRAQELASKLEDAPDGVRWHFVGRLQRNKAKLVVGHVDLIHSVDRVSLAETVSAQAVDRDIVQRVLVQVDVAGEERKGGCPPEQVPALLARIADLPGVHADGLMTIPPIDADPAAMFERLRALRARLLPTFPQLTELSMGMSADLEVAVASGATIVRVGTAIFGARPRNR
jgi:pyridoxal phosphate enzyme (YggS family)